jgi:hypothetical protein
MKIVLQALTAEKNPQQTVAVSTEVNLSPESLTNLTTLLTELEKPFDVLKGEMSLGLLQTTIKKVEESNESSHVDQVLKLYENLRDGKMAFKSLTRHPVKDVGDQKEVTFTLKMMVSEMPKS